MPKTSSFQKGANLEDKVESVFRAHKYRTLRNRDKSGQEVDIIATQKDKNGRDEITFIECKYMESGSISNQTVFETIAPFREHYSSFKATKFVLVTNRTFSQKAYRAAESFPPLTLLSLAELERHLSGLVSSIQEKVREYEEDSFFPTFIPLKGKYQTASRATGPKETDNISNWLTDLFSADETCFASIIGDFGTGKTTLAKRINYLLAKKYLENASQFLPVLMPLRNIYHHADVEQYVAAKIEESLSVKIPPENVASFCRENNIVAILDGFDEIKTHSNRLDREDNLTKILRIGSFSKHLLLTSRPTHFGSPKELSQMAGRILKRRNHLVEGGELREIDVTKKAKENYQELLGTVRSQFSGKIKDPDQFSYVVNLSIQPLSRDDVRQALKIYENDLKTKYGRTLDFVTDRLFSIYDIEDLLTRPLLLNMIIVLVLTGKVDFRNENLRIGAAGIYMLHVEGCLTRDYELGESRQFLTKAERMEFCRRISYAIFEKEIGLELDADDFEFSILEAFEEENPIIERLRELPLDQVITDIRTCSFLSKSSDISLAFAHKSFYEFFLASFIRDNLQSSAVLDMFSKRRISFEVLYFLSSFSILDDVFEAEFNNWSAKKPTENFRVNALSVQILFSRMSRDFDLSGVKLEGFNLSNKVFAECKFQGSKFINCKAKILEIHHCKDIKLETRDCAFETIRIAGTSGAFRFSGNFERVENSACDGLLSILEGQIGTFRMEGGSGCRIDSSSTQTGKIELFNQRQTTVYSDGRLSEFDVIKSNRIVFIEPEDTEKVCKIKWDNDSTVLLFVSKRQFARLAKMDAFQLGSGICFVNDEHLDLKEFSEWSRFNLRAPAVSRHNFSIFNGKQNLQKAIHLILSKPIKDFSLDNIRAELIKIR